MMAGTADIEHRRLGRSDVIVPRVALGCAPFGGFGSAPEFFGRGLSEREAFALMDAAWELGISHFDTADAYGGGRSERMVGHWIDSRGVRPVLTTKTFNPMYAGGDRGLAPARVTHHVELSLERLGVDAVDLYLAHDFDPDVPLTDSLAAFDAALAAGKIRAYGVSNFTAPQLQDALDAGAPEAIQNSYSLLHRDDGRYVLPLCAERAVAYVAYSPLEGGWLAGRYRRGDPYPAGSRMAVRPSVHGFVAGRGVAVFDALDELRTVADGHGRSMAAVALAWLLADDRVTQIVVGPQRPEHLAAVAEALTMSLGTSERARLDAAFAPPTSESRSGHA